MKDLLQFTREHFEIKKTPIPTSEGPFSQEDMGVRLVLGGRMRES